MDKEKQNGKEGVVGGGGSVKRVEEKKQQRRKGVKMIDKELWWKRRDARDRGEEREYM